MQRRRGSRGRRDVRRDGQPAGGGGAVVPGYGHRSRGDRQRALLHRAVRHLRLPRPRHHGLRRKRRAVRGAGPRRGATRAERRPAVRRQRRAARPPQRAQGRAGGGTGDRRCRPLARSARPRRGAVRSDQHRGRGGAQRPGGGAQHGRHGRRTAGTGPAGEDLVDGRPARAACRP